MKKAIIMAAAIFASLNIFGQGTVNFSNIGLTGAQIIDSTTGAAAVSGSKFTVGLYWAHDGITDEALFQLAGATTGIAGQAGALTGLYSGGTRTVDITPPGFFAMFQVRAWETSFGSFDAAATGGGLVGKSSIIRVDTGDPTVIPPGTPGSLKGISGITLAIVPEPSVIGLSLLGAGALLLLRRRK